VKRDVGGERRLSHARTAGNDDEVGRLKPAEQRIDVGKAGNQPGNPPAAGLRLFGEFDRALQRLGEIDRPGAIFRTLADSVERFFSVFDLVLRRLVVRRFIGRVHDVLADADQRTTNREIMQDAREVAHVGQSGCRLDEAREIGVTADLHQSGIGLHRRMQRQRCEDHAAAFT
jgi:hypothetical protein